MRWKKILYGLFVTILFLNVDLFFRNEPRCEEAVIELKISQFGSPSWPQQTEVLEPWARKIEKLTNGRIKFSLFPNEILGKAVEQYDIALKGIADIVLGLPDYTPGRFPLVSCIKLPFLGVQNAEKASLVLWRLYQKYLKDEFKDVKVLWMFCNGPFQLHTINKKVKTLQDLKGLRIRMSDPTSAKALELLGAVTVSCTVIDGYNLMKEGKLDGIVIPWEGALDFKYLELCKYHTVINIYAMPFYVVMNKERYESLPADIKKTIDDNSGEAMAALAGRVMDNGDIKGERFAQARGDFIYTLPKAERERWKKITMPLGDKWVEEMQAKGLPGQEVLTYVVDLFIQIQE